VNVVVQNFHNTINLKIYFVSKHYKQQVMLNDHLQLDENELYVDQLVPLFPIVKNRIKEKNSKKFKHTLGR
jgi:deoxyadenosine/deoxycytidine kinase